MSLPDDIAAAQLDEYRQQFEAGRADALMHALLLCAKHELVMPEWVVWELHQGWHRFVNRDADDLGEAFGITWPKGKHTAAYLKKRRLQFAIHSRIRELHLKQEWHYRNGEWHQAKNCPLDDKLFEQVGKEFHIGKKLASEYYYAVKRIIENPPIAVSLLLEDYAGPTD